MKTLILGGVRSGKSRYAETLAKRSRLPVTYIATATARDAEMAARIHGHRVRRPPHWRTVEEPIELAKVLEHNAEENGCVIVDCLTLWMTNLLVSADESAFVRERDALLALIDTLAGEIILVSNETNMGVTPMSELSRRYCDEAGVLHQQVARTCDSVVIVIAGLPQFLKGESVD